MPVTTKRPTGPPIAKPAALATPNPTAPPVAAPATVNTFFFSINESNKSKASYL